MLSSVAICTAFLLLALTKRERESWGGGVGGGGFGGERWGVGGCAGSRGGGGVGGKGRATRLLNLHVGT